MKKSPTRTAPTNDRKVGPEVRDSMNSEIVPRTVSILPCRTVKGGAFRGALQFKMCRGKIPAGLEVSEVHGPGVEQVRVVELVKKFASCYQKHHTYNCPHLY